MSNRIAHYLAGGEGGTTIQYSEDGMDWYGCTNTFDTKCNKIICLPETGFCVAAGEDTGGKSIKYSDDGKTWTDSDINETNIKDVFLEIEEGIPHTWIAVSNSRNFYMSSDGKKWISPSNNINVEDSDPARWPDIGNGVNFSYIKKKEDWGNDIRTFLLGTNGILTVIPFSNYNALEIYGFKQTDWDFNPTNKDNLNINQTDNITKLKDLKGVQKTLALGDNPKFFDDTTNLFQKIPDLKVTLSSETHPQIQTGIFSAEQVNDQIFIGSDKNVYVMDSDLKLVTKKDFFSNTVNEKYTLTDSTKINSLMYDLLHKFTFAGITTTGGSTSSIQYYSDSSKIFLYVNSGGFTIGCYTLTTRTAPQSEIDKVAKKPDVNVKDTSNNNNTSTFKPTATSTPSKSDTPSIPPPVKTVSNKTQRPPPIEMLPAPKKSSGRSVKVHHTKIL